MSGYWRSDRPPAQPLPQRRLREARWHRAWRSHHDRRDRAAERVQHDPDVHRGSVSVAVGQADGGEVHSLTTLPASSSASVAASPRPRRLF